TAPAGSAPHSGSVPPAGSSDLVRAARGSGRGSSPTPIFRWGHLHVLSKLGSGSFGEVFRAFDPALQREVALKLWRIDPALEAESFLAEARRLARVSHPNVLSVHGADQHDGRLGMWTDLLTGKTLEQWIDVEGPMAAREAAGMGIELCRAVAAV